MAKTKQQLIVENNSQFPDNNTGFIEPDNLRTFNRDMIESMVGELAYGAYTASIALQSASFNNRIDALEGLSSSLSASVTAISSSVGALSASVLQLNDYTSSANNRLDALEIFTGSLNGFTASVEAQFAIYNEEIYNLNVHSQSLNAFTASVNSKFNTLSTTTASLQSQVNTLISATSSYAISASVAAVDAAQQSQIDQLTAFTGSVGSAATGSLFASASFTNDTITFTKGNGTTQTLGGFANTGSNVFVGDQIISGNLDISGTVSASLQEGYLYVGDASGRMLAVATSSIITQVNTGSLVNTASFNDFSSSVATTFTAVQASTASLNAFTSSAAGRLTNIEATTASLNISRTNLNSFTASAAGRLNNLEATTASLNTSVTNLNSFTSSANSRLNSLETKSGSYATTGSNYFVGNQLISGSVSVTGSIFLRSGSLSGSVISNLTDVYTNVAEVDYVVTITSASYATLVSQSAVKDNTLYVVTGDVGYLLSGVFNTYTASINTKFDNVQASTASLNSFTSSAAGRLSNLESTTASLNISVTNLNSFTSSANTKFSNIQASTASLNSFTASADGRLTNLESTTASLNTSVSNLNTFTASTAGRLTNIEATTASLNTSVTNLNSFTSSQTNLNGTFATTGSNSFNGNQIITGSLTASLQEGYAWVGNSVGITAAVPTSSFGGGGGTGAGFPFTGSAQISGSLGITGSIQFQSENFYVSGANSGSFISNITDTYTSSTPIKYVTTLDSASYAALATGSTFSPDTLYVVSGALSIPNVTEGNIVVTGSITITGSAYGNVNTLTVTSATASMDMRAANFFVLTLPTGSTTHLDATNVGLGQTVSLLVKQATTATGSLVFSPEFKFPTGSRYTATPTGSAQDIITFVTFNSTSEVFATSVKQLV